MPDDGFEVKIDAQEMRQLITDRHDRDILVAHAKPTDAPAEEKPAASAC